MTDVTTLQKSLLMIQKLKKRLQEQQTGQAEPVAIVGMACRLPEAENIEQFWQYLCQGKSMITPIPEGRRTLLKGSGASIGQADPLEYRGGYLNHIDAFDASFFGISPREARWMDPQQRVLLEVSCEAFEDAGLTNEALAGSSTGVFSSLYSSQYGHLQTLDSDMDALFVPTGSALSIAANRLSYLFDLRGPSLVLDTACSSSLIAIQMACLNLQAGRCEQAIVSAVNINLLPSVHAILLKAGMLSPTGTCHTFDGRANGYVQGEGAGAIILKPLSRALRDRDRIYAVIAGSAVNQDGKTNGLTAPNGLQQEQLLRSACQVAQVNPAQMAYVECHGTGTLLGDPIEVQALGEVIGKEREQNTPCLIGSVKTGVGHLEPAAGIISLIKTALVLQRGMVPPHPDFQTPNPHIAFDRYHLRVPCKLEQLPRYGEVCYAGVSGFGFGGANAHIVLREVKPEEQLASAVNPDSQEELFTLSAKDDKALRDLAVGWCEFIKANPDQDLAQICYNLHIRRSHYSSRLALVARSTRDLYQQLQAWCSKPVLTDDTKKSAQKKRIREFDGMALSTLANHYLTQASIDWKTFEASRFYPHLDMPFYPWQHKSYWPAFQSGHSGQPEQFTDGYPMRGKVLHSPLAQHQFEFVIDTKTLPEVQDSFYVLHAGYYIEMLAYAVSQLRQSPAFTVLDLAFSSPMLVPEGKKVTVQLILSRDSDPSFTFYSDDGSNAWIEHARGSLSFDVSVPEMPSLNKPNQNQGDDASFYQRITGMGMPAGDTIRWISAYAVENNRLFSQLRKAKPVERGEQFFIKIHPGIVDACIQTLFLLLPDNLVKPYVASGMGKVVIHGRLDEACYIYTRLDRIEAEGKTLVGDWYLLDRDYRCIASCEALCMAQLNDNLQIDRVMQMQGQFRPDWSLPRTECKSQLMRYLIQQFSLVFAIPEDDISVHRSLHDMGMDSLMALAIMRIIETSLDVTWSLPQLMKGPSIDDIAEQVLTSKAIVDKQPSFIAGLECENAWIACRKKQSDPAIRLFCFPFGGGGASIYREWQALLPESIEVCPVQLPGRENRMDEKPMDDPEKLVVLLADALQPLMDRPFAFFGHSFGSLIAFELTRYLRQHGRPTPEHLFVSAYPDPRMPSRSLDNLLKDLEQQGIQLFELNHGKIGQFSDEQLTRMTTIFRNNGVVDYSDERMNKSIVQVLLPVFIGDMSIVRRYAWHDARPLDCPITVFSGTQDTWVPFGDMKGWSSHTENDCTFKSFDSGHLFIREKAVLQEVTRVIAGALEFVAAG